MAEFTNKIVSAFYADEEYSEIIVRYEQDDKLFVYIVPNDPNNADYKELVRCAWPDKRILEETIQVKRAESKAFNTEVDLAARALVSEKLDELDKKMSMNDSVEKIFFTLLNREESADELFQFKIWALDQEYIINATKEQKSELRKVTSILDGLNFLDKIKN